MMKTRRMRRFEAQLPDALDMMARSLRAGHALTTGIEMAGQEFPDPLGPEFAKTVAQISFGVGMEQALRNLTKRVDCPDLKFLAVSIIIQRETGGNLAEILETISRLIRERHKLLGKIRALSAEGKLSAIILLALPFLVAAAMLALNPSYLDSLLSDPLGRVLIVAAVMMMLLGVGAIKKTVDIKYRGGDRGPFNSGRRLSCGSGSLPSSCTFFSRNGEHAVLAAKVRDFSGVATAGIGEAGCDLPSGQASGLLARITTSLGNLIKPQKKEELSLLQKKFLKAGLRSRSALFVTFFGAKAFCAFCLSVGFVAAFVIFRVHIAVLNAMMLIIGLTMAGFYAPNVWLSLRLPGDRRHSCGVSPTPLTSSLSARKRGWDSTPRLRGWGTKCGSAAKS